MTNPVEYTVKVYPNGVKYWRLNGKLHREDGPAIENTDGFKAWYLHDKRHRENGPAVEADGFKNWYLNGERHREDGPAIENANGYEAWYLHDKNLTEKEFNAKMNPVVKELTVRELEKLLGYSIKVVK